MSVRPITVANPSFTLDANARDCPPLQFVREFTVNALEAIDARRRERGLANPSADRVVWRQFTELGVLAAAPKLACIDTGIGMTPEEMDRYIRALASTSKRQALDGNYGWGAKISAAERNPAGLTYLSWTGAPDTGRTCTLAHDQASGQWGLEEEPETGELFLPVPADMCPPEIRRAGWRGTAVVFFGTGQKQDTTLPPSEDMGADWLLKAVNTRFYELPDDIEIRCQRPGESGARRALGQRALLDEQTEQHGVVALSDARVRWRILTDDHERRKKEAGRWASVGHRAALYRGELYELRTANAGGYRKLQEFGIHFGYQRVVLYIEPRHVEADTVRARLLVKRTDGGEKDLPWGRWADEFNAKMPAALRDLVARAAGKMAARDRREILRHLQQIAKDMPLPRYRLAPDGELHGQPTHAGTGEDTDRGGGEARTGEEAGSAHGGSVVSLFTRPEGERLRQEDALEIPDIKPVWVSVADGSRVPPVLDDRAATFLQRDAMVQLSEDFRGYQVLLNYFRGRWGHLGIDQLVISEVKAAFEDQVVEYIVGILRLRWVGQDVEHALDDRSLTACLMQHWTMAGRIEERLNRRLGKAA